jgi:uncharacterized membrane protein
VKKSARPPARDSARPAAPAGVRRWQAITDRLQPEWVFLALALSFGTALAFVTPPFSVPDEEAHFRRAFEISEGRIIALKQGDFTGDNLPRSLVEIYDRYRPLNDAPEQKTTATATLESLRIPVDLDDRGFVAFSNSAIHSPLIYLPQSLAVFLTRRCTSSLLAGLYAGRLFNLLSTAFLVFLAVRLTPIAKWGFAVLGLTPMTLSLMASLSSDALTNSFAFLMVALALACAFGAERPVSRRMIVYMAVTGAALGLSKQAYFLLPLCYLLIPRSALGSSRRYWLCFAIVQAATVGAVLVWAAVVRDIYSPSDLSYGMNPRAQIRLMLADPLEALLVLLRTTRYAEFYGEEYLGWLGRVGLRMPTLVYLIEVGLLAVVFIGTYDSEKGPTTRQALVAAGVAFLVTLTVLVVIHITWDAVGSSSVALQGRYFIPIGPLMGVALSRLGALGRGSGARVSVRVPGLVTICVPIALAGTLVRVVDRYFVDSPQAAAQRLSSEGEALLREGGHEANARELFERALTIDSDNASAHLNLGLLFADSRWQEAVSHLRAALRLKPDDVAAMNNLATILVRQGEHAEAIRLLQEAIRLKPGEQTLQDNLERARKRQDAMRGAPQQIAAALEARAKDGMIEEGAAGDGMYLKPNRGRVLKKDGSRLFPRVEVLWRCPPPSGAAIRLFGKDGGPASDGRRMPFYACSAEPVGPNRVFVFPPPMGVAVFADEDISWYYQVPLADLNAAEREKERAYRQQNGVHFPLALLPE